MDNCYPPFEQLGPVVYPPQVTCDLYNFCTCREQQWHSHIQHRARAVTRKGLVNLIQAQSSLHRIYFHPSEFQCLFLFIHFGYSIHSKYLSVQLDCCKVSHRTYQYLICNALMPYNFALFQKSGQNHCFNVWTEALSSMVFAKLLAVHLFSKIHLVLTSASAVANHDITLQ